MNTTKLRSEALESFVTCFNICYPDWEVGDDPGRDLTAEHVEYSYTTSYIGKCGPQPYGRVYFAINSSWYEDASPGDRLGLLIHELAHVKHTNHSPSFWEQVVENYQMLRSYAEAVESVILGDLSWDGVEEYLVRDPLTQSVDNRSEIVYERRMKIAKAVGYPQDEVTPFDKMHVLVPRWLENQVKRVSLHRLEFERKTPDEVVEYFHQRSKPHVEKRDGAHIIHPLPGQKAGTGYELLDGQELATLADYVGCTHIYIDCSGASQAAERAASQSGTAD